MLDDLDKAANSKEQLTEAQVKKLQDKWGKDLQNPFCVQAMADAYRAKHGKDANFSDMLNRLAVNTAGPAYIPNESERATMASFTERIGTAMVLSTGGINASGAEGLGRSETYALMKDRLFGQDGSTKISQIETSNIADIKASFDTIYNREPGTGWQIRGYEFTLRRLVMLLERIPTWPTAVPPTRGEKTPSPQNLLPMITTMNEALR